MHGLSFEAHYAIVALTSMARRPSDGVVQMREISAREGLPGPFLSKILLKLRHRDLVQSRHGRGGGYRLSRPPSEISVEDVLEACGDQGRSFDVTSRAVTTDPALAAGLARLDQRVQTQLRETTIADLAGIPSEPSEAGVGNARLLASI